MLMTFLFVMCFFVSEIIVSQYIILAGPFVRFFLRVELLVLYTLLIKYLFEYFERAESAEEEIAGIPEPSGHSEVKDNTAEKTIHHEENRRKNDEHRAGSIETEA